MPLDNPAAEAKAAANTAGSGKFVRYADIDQRYKLVHTHNPIARSFSMSNLEMMESTTTSMTARQLTVLITNKSL